MSAGKLLPLLNRPPQALFYQSIHMPWHDFYNLKHSWGEAQSLLLDRLWLEDCRPFAESIRPSLLYRRPQR
jgi:hypothetical protein